MAENKAINPSSVKIFPRNLTAKADYIVRGNPTNSRPESGVQNCFPGLELDIRNIEQHFFTGTRFEFHRDEGAILVDVRQDADLLISGLTESDWKTTGTPLYLWALYGVSKINQKPLLWGFKNLSGLDVWARVHDLLPGRIAILVGPWPGSNNKLSPGDIEEILKEVYEGKNPTEQYKLVRNTETAQLVYAAFSQDRAPYLDDNGVIDVKSYRPGELTKSLCAPWVYDFRDCTCFYWSSNKPDIVDSADGKVSNINFLRNTASREGTPPADIEVYGSRRDTELTYIDLVNGWWEQLPVVLNDRESTAFFPLPHPPLSDLLTRDQVVAELNYLATVEHALIAEYLYAMYSINTVVELTAGEGQKQRDFFNAAQEVFKVAVDEMRHFRWVNEVLHHLGAPPSVNRAEIIGKKPEAGSGRKMDMKRQFLERPFELKFLTSDTLQWFIDVEAPSQNANEQLDGMYVAILESVNLQQDIFPEYKVVLPIIKLIIDEGQQHYERFSKVKAALSVYKEEDFLRTPNTKPGHVQQQIALICDQYYQSILEVIHITTTLGDKSSGILIKAAVRTMINLNEAAYLIASQGVLPQFNLSPQPQLQKSLPPDSAVVVLKNREDTLQQKLAHLASTSGGNEKEMAQKHIGLNTMLYQQMRHIVQQSANE